LFEGGAREPTIVRWPGHIPANAVCNEPSALYDWLATLTEVAGVPAPANTDGISLLPTLTGHPDKQRHHPYLYSEYLGTMSGPVSKEVVARKGYKKRGQEQSVRLGDYAGVRYDIQSPNDPLKLYNIVTDPHEDHDLSSDPGVQKTLAQMRDLLITARTPNPSSPRPYDEELLPAVPAPSQIGSLATATFQGHWPWLPDFHSLTPEKHGTADGFVLPDQLGKNPKGKGPREQAGPEIGIDFEGYIDVPTDGIYTFTVTSDTGTVLWLHDALIVDDDYTHDDAPRSGTIRLKAGWHPIRLFYRHEPAEFQPRLMVGLHGPGLDRDFIAPAMLGHD
jgi:hypothetical protein